MIIKKLIDLLNQCDQDAAVNVWDAYYDAPSEDVHVSVGADGTVHIGNNVFGKEVPNA